MLAGSQCGPKLKLCRLSSQSMLGAVSGGGGADVDRVHHCKCNDLVRARLFRSGIVGAMEQAPLDHRIDELLAATAPDGRVIVGIVGPPGAGKTTLAATLVAAAAARHGAGTAVVLPMDGFHLANEVLEALGRRHRKGAPDTFDGDGFAAAGRAGRPP